MILMSLGILFSYLIGSVPTGYIIGKLVKRIDIRLVGSGNVGATNVFRTVGKKWGVIVLVIDILKGIVAVIGVTQICASDIVSVKYLQCIYGVAAICGHNWTIFLRFRGGKGVATTCGVILAIFPKALGLSLSVFVLTVTFSKYVSLGSLIGAAVFPVFLWLCYRHYDGFYFFIIFSVVLVIFIVYRHKANIKRLINGSEGKITFSKD